MGYDAIGFASLTPWLSRAEDISDRWDMYEWTKHNHLGGVDLICGSYPKTSMPGATCIIVAIKDYFFQSFPKTLTGKIGRVYQKRYYLASENEESPQRQNRMINFVSEKGYKIIFDPHVSARLAAARAGLTTFGKNNHAYLGDRTGSWIGIDLFLSDLPFEGAEKSPVLGCDEKCNNCIKACPTGALYEPFKLDPRKCIAYLTYMEQGPIARDVRPKMGTWIFGCDRCQEVCPRNKQRLSEDLPGDPRLEAEYENFELGKVLNMTDEYFHKYIKNLLYYIKDKRFYQRNAAIAIGNQKDEKYVPDLITALDNPDDLVRGHVVWALGEMQSKKAFQALKKLWKTEKDEFVREEIDAAVVSRR